ncbi:hypothetical protein SCA6_006865, partial [Theobroma cacao]
VRSAALAAARSAALAAASFCFPINSVIRAVGRPLIGFRAPIVIIISESSATAGVRL